MAWLRKQGTNYWVYWRDGGRGVPTRCTNAGPKRADAVRLKGEIEHRRRMAPFGIALPQPISFEVFADRWVKNRMVKRQTLRRDQSAIRAYLVPRFRSTLVYAISTEQVTECMADVAAKSSAANAKRVIAVLRKMLADAKRWKYASENPAAEVEMPAASKRLEAFPTVGELCAAISATAAHHRPLVFTALLTGLRWGELVALRWSDLNLEAGKLSVRRSIPVGNHQPTTPKGGGQRVVDLLPPVLQVLMDIPQRSMLVFPGARGARLNHGYFYRRFWKPAMKATGLSMRFHDLRHGYASLMLAFGETVLYVSRQLGHSSAKLTLDTYGHLVEEGRRLDRAKTLIKFEESLRGATAVQLSEEKEWTKRGAGGGN